MTNPRLSNSRFIRLLPRLAYFHACAQHGSTSAAAEQLNLTKGAVSQQLIKLEQQLGTPLFTRTPSGLELTQVGQQLLPRVERALAEIDQGLQDVQQQPNRPVRIHTTPSLAYRWLIPRLSSFHALHPEIQVEVVAEGSLLDPSDKSLDLAIDYSDGHHPGFHSQKLFDEYLTPVASPQYLQKFRTGTKNFWTGINSAQTKTGTGIILLHDAKAWRGAERDSEWNNWLTRQGLHFTPDSEHFFNRSDMAVAAAVAGLGIALARKHLLIDELSSGQLVALEKEQISSHHYYLLHPDKQLLSVPSQQLHQWLSTQD